MLKHWCPVFCMWFFVWAPLPHSRNERLSLILPFLLARPLSLSLPLHTMIAYIHTVPTPTGSESYFVCAQFALYDFGGRIVCYFWSVRSCVSDPFGRQEQGHSWYRLCRVRRHLRCQISCRSFEWFQCWGSVFGCVVLSTSQIPQTCRTRRKRTGLARIAASRAKTQRCPWWDEQQVEVVGVVCA